MSRTHPEPLTLIFNVFLFELIGRRISQHNSLRKPFGNDICSVIWSSSTLYTAGKGTPPNDGYVIITLFFFKQTYWLVKKSYELNLSSWLKMCTGRDSNQEPFNLIDNALPNEISGLYSNQHSLLKQPIENDVWYVICRPNILIKENWQLKSKVLCPSQAVSHLHLHGKINARNN